MCRALALAAPAVDATEGSRSVCVRAPVARQQGHVLVVLSRGQACVRGWRERENIQVSPEETG